MGLLSVAEQALDGSGSAALDGLRLGFVILVGVSTAAGSVAVISKSPLGRLTRWVWRRLVADPIRTWHQTAVADVIEDRVFPITAHNTERIDLLVAELTPNGGQSVKDHVGSLVQGQKRIFARLDAQHARLEALEDYVTDRRT